MILTDKLSNIANAIRSKTGKSEEMTLDEMPAEIEGIFGNKVEKPFDCHSVTFVYGDKSYVRSVADGDTCADPVERGLIPTPTKESTAQYDYTYYGWGASDGGAADDTILQNITEDKTVYAVFTATVRYYTIKWLDSDGVTELPGQKQWAYGSVPSYAPTKAGHTFTGWTPEPVPVTGDASYTATWIDKLDFNTMSWAEIAEYAEAGIAETVFDLGATKTWKGKNNNSYTAKIVGFNHDDLADGSGKAGITLMITSHFLNHYWNATGSSAQKIACWDESYARKTLSDNISILGEECLAVAKTVKKSFYKTSTYTYETTEDIFFLPAAIEVGKNYMVNEGKTYAAFLESSIIEDTYGNAQPYWTRTKAGGSYVYVINKDGSITTYNQGSDSYGYQCTYFFCV